MESQENRETLYFGRQKTPNQYLHHFLHVAEQYSEKYTRISELHPRYRLHVTVCSKLAIHRQQTAEDYFFTLQHIASPTHDTVVYQEEKEMINAIPLAKA